MTIKYLKKAIKTPSTDEQKTREIVQNILNDIEKRGEKSIRELTKKSVKGLESLVGVPGTLGGALIMNAGAYGSEISNYLISIKVLDLDGNEKIYKKEDINFSYRFSSIAKTDIVIEAKFKFKKGNLSNIIKNRSSASQKRRNNQPLQFRSAGSIFKNPKSVLAFVSNSNPAPSSLLNLPLPSITGVVKGSPLVPVTGV